MTRIYKIFRTLCYSMLLPVFLAAPLALTGCGGGDEPEIETNPPEPSMQENVITDVTSLTLAPGRTMHSGRQVSLTGLEVIATAGENAFFVADARPSSGIAAMSPDSAGDETTAMPGGPLDEDHDTRLLVVLDPSLSHEGQTTAPLTADTTAVTRDNLSTADTASVASTMMPAEGELVSVSGVVAVGSPEEVQEHIGIDMEAMGFDEEIVYVIADQVVRQPQ